MLLLKENIQVFAAPRIKIGYFNYIFMTTANTTRTIVSIGTGAVLTHQIRTTTAIIRSTPT